MSYICKCGNKVFEKALEPVTTPLEVGTDPKPSVPFLRCTNKNCKRPISEALELKWECSACRGMSFRELGITEIGSVIDGRICSPHTRVMVVECAGCRKKYSKEQLEEQAELRAYDSGFVVVKALLRKH